MISSACLVVVKGED